MTTFLSEDCVRVNVPCGDWKSSVKAGTDLLAAKGCIEPRYLDAIIEHHEQMGPYMVIAPGIMLAHARPEDGAKDVALSFVTLKEPVVFGNETNDPVRLVITLATTDPRVHVEMLGKLMEFLSNEEDLGEVMRADDIDTVLRITGKYA